MNKILMLQISLLLLLLVQSSEAALLDININSLKEEYSIDENAEFNIKITNPTPTDLDLRLSITFQRINSKEFFTQPILKVLTIDANNTFSEILERSIRPSGEYKAVVILTDDRDSILYKNELFFKILSDLPELAFNISICKDENCNFEQRIFTKYEFVYLNYNSEVSNPTIISTLTLPDKTTKQITLPYSFKAEQIGTYNLEVTASKEGYKTVTKKIQFGVIEKEANIQYSEPRIESSKSYFNKGILYASIGIIILIILFWLYKRKQ